MREYRVWKKEEENALRLGVAKHGSGAWELIRTDPEFHSKLYASLTQLYVAMRFSHGRRELLSDIRAQASSGLYEDSLRPRSFLVPIQAATSL